MVVLDYRENMEQNERFDRTMAGDAIPLYPLRWHGVPEENQIIDVKMMKNSNLDAETKLLFKRHVNRVRTAQRRATETVEERQRRLEKNRVRNRLRRASETIDQRAERNLKNKERNRLRRLKEGSDPSIPSSVIVSIFEESASNNDDDSAINQSTTTNTSS